MPRIMFVDDDPMVLRVLEYQATLWGLECTLVGDSSAVLEAARASSPDVIVMDVLMPAGDGSEVMGLLREEPACATIPVILVTAARLDVDSRIRGLELGAIDYLIKPMEPAELRARINRAIAFAASIRIRGAHDVELVQNVASYLNHTLNNMLATIQTATDILEDATEAEVGKVSQLISTKIREIHEVLVRLARVRRVELTNYLPGETMLDLERSEVKDTGRPFAA